MKSTEHSPSQLHVQNKDLESFSTLINPSANRAAAELGASNAFENTSLLLKLVNQNTDDSGPLGPVFIKAPTIKSSKPVSH
jgi:hypothetical protein